MTNNLSLFATDDSCISVFLFFLATIGFIQLQYFTDDYLFYYLRLMALSDFANNNSFSKQQKNTKI